MDVKLLTRKTITFAHNVFFNYIGLLSFVFFAISYFSFTYFQNEKVGFIYYALLLVPLFHGFAFIYQLTRFVKNKITLEGHVFNNLLKNLHTTRDKAFYDNFFPLFSIVFIASFYSMGLIYVPKFVDTIYLFYNDPSYFPATIIFLFLSGFYVFASFLSLYIFQQGNELLNNSIAIKNEYCLKNDISVKDTSSMMFTLYDGHVINLLFDDLIVNVKKNEAIYKNKKYNYTALNNYLNETGLSIKELSTPDWSVVAFMSI
jgi:hypothetical protein